MKQGDIPGALRSLRDGVKQAVARSANVRARIDKFLYPESATPGTTSTFQVDTAMESFLSGGWLGKGPGEGSERPKPSRS